MKKLIALLTLVFCFNCYSQFAPPRGGGKTKENKPTGTRELRPKGSAIPANRIPQLGGLLGGGGVPMPLPSGKVGIPKANSKPILSNHGLEGWGKENGVSIEVMDFSGLDKTFDTKGIKNQVELKLRLAGIKVKEDAFGDVLIVRCFPWLTNKTVKGYIIFLQPIRKMSFKYNNKEYYAGCNAAETYARFSTPNPREYLDKALDQLLLNYLKANPKK